MFLALVKSNFGPVLGVEEMAIFKYWKTGLFAGLATVALSGCVLIGGGVANLIETSEFKADGPNLFMNVSSTANHLANFRTRLRK